MVLKRKMCRGEGGSLVRGLQSVPRTNFLTGGDLKTVMRGKEKNVRNSHE